MKITSVFLVVLLMGACSSRPPPRERITVDLSEPRCKAGSADAYFDKFLSTSGMKISPINAFYYPYDDVLCLRYKIDLITYYQFWSKANRDVFINGLRQYKEDFEQRNLINSNRQTKRNYGTVLGYSIWETSRISTQGRSYPDIEIGYYFKKNSPFFSITQREAENENETSKESYRKSLNQVIYLTQAQADHLAGLFDQDYLLELIPEDDEKDSFFRRLFN